MSTEFSMRDVGETALLCYLPPQHKHIWQEDGVDDLWKQFAYAVIHNRLDEVKWLLNSDRVISESAVYEYLCNTRQIDPNDEDLLQLFHSEGIHDSDGERLPGHELIEVIVDDWRTKLSSRRAYEDVLMKSCFREYAPEEHYCDSCEEQTQEIQKYKYDLNQDRLRIFLDDFLTDPYTGNLQKSRRI
jgi:hypothetical protein